MGDNDGESNDEMVMITIRKRKMVTMELMKMKA